MQRRAGPNPFALRQDAPIGVVAGMENPLRERLRRRLIVRKSPRPEPVQKRLDPAARKVFRQSRPELGEGVDDDGGDQACVEIGARRIPAIDPTFVVGAPHPQRGAQRPR